MVGWRSVASDGLLCTVDGFNLQRQATVVQQARDIDTVVRRAGGGINSDKPSQ